MRYKLYINNILCDLPDNFRPEYDFCASDLREFNLRGGTSVKFSGLPFTENNNRALNFSNNINSYTRFNNNTNVSAVFIDSSSAVNGVIKIESIGGGTYSLQLITSLGSFLAKLENKKLSELNFSAFNHQLTRANQIASETSTAMPYVYDLCNRGDFYGFDAITPEDRYPAWKFYNLFQQIVLEAGYNLSSAFINTAYYKQHCFLYSRENFNNTVSYSYPTQQLVDAVAFELQLPSNVFYQPQYAGFAPIDITQLFSTQIKKGDSINATSAYLQLNEAAQMSINAALNITNYGYETKFKIEISAYNLNATTSAIIKTVEDTLALGETKTIECETENLYFPANTRFYLKISADATAVGQAITFQINKNNADLYSTLKCTPSLRLVTNQMVEVSEHLPDILQTDFIRINKELFCLFFDINENTKTLICEPYNTFYLTTNVKNITSYVDKRTIELEYIDKPKEIKFEFAEDGSDATYKEYYKAPIGSHIYETETKFSKAIETIGQDLSYPIFAKCPQIFRGSNLEQIPILRADLNSSEQKLWTNLKVVRYMGQTNTNNIDGYRQTYKLFYGFGAYIINQSYPRFIPVSWDNTGETDHVSLFSEHWENYVKEVKEGLIVNCAIQYNASQLSTLNMRDLVILESDNWTANIFRINKIITDKSGEIMSRLELVPFPFLTNSILTAVPRIPIINSSTLLFETDNNGNIMLKMRGRTAITLNTDGSVNVGEGNTAYTTISGIITPAYTLDSNGLIIPANF